MEKSSITRNPFSSSAEWREHECGHECERKRWKCWVVGCKRRPSPTEREREREEDAWADVCNAIDHTTLTSSNFHFFHTDGYNAARLCSLEVRVTLRMFVTFVITVCSSPFVTRGGWNARNWYLDIGSICYVFTEYEKKRFGVKSFNFEMNNPELIIN